jgi:hypothetical protein
MVGTKNTMVASKMISGKEGISLETGVGSLESSWAG